MTARKKNISQFGLVAVIYPCARCARSLPYYNFVRVENASCAAIYGQVQGYIPFRIEQYCTNDFEEAPVRRLTNIAVYSGLLTVLAMAQVGLLSGFCG